MMTCVIDSCLTWRCSIRGRGNRDAISIDSNPMLWLLGKLSAARFPIQNPALRNDACPGIIRVSEIGENRHVGTDLRKPGSPPRGSRAPPEREGSEQRQRLAHGCRYVYRSRVFENRR